MSAFDDLRHEMDSRKVKRRKVESLLEKLREQTRFPHPKTDSDYEFLTDLVLHHSSQFPAKIRSAIEAAKDSMQSLGDDSSETPAQHFSSSVFEAVIRLLFSLARPDDSFDSARTPTATWCGLDSDVDTEDQIELTLRMYPRIFRATRDINYGEWDFRRYSAVIYMASSVKSVTFIPFVLDLASEFDMLQSTDMVFLSCVLLNNSLTRVRFNEDPSPELDEASLAVLSRLKERGYMRDEIIWIIVIRFVLETFSFPRPMDFIERRLRLLIGWKPTLVQEFEENSELNTSLISILSNFDFEQVLGTGLGKRKMDIRLYDVALELGSLHYPEELLGFGFHGWNFESACQAFGNEEVKRSMNDKIASTLAQSDKNERNKMLLGWILQTATDDAICLDGLYTLIRFDPSVLMNSRTRRRKPVGGMEILNLAMSRDALGRDGETM